MRSIKFILLLTLIAGGAWWLWLSDSSIKEVVSQYIENGEILTLEAKYTPEQIMEINRRELLTDTKTYKDSALKYYPYLLMEVKYVQPDKKTREGVILWGMVDGEMVLSTDNWERTHGLEDAILASATSNDFKIINALARNKGYMTREELHKDLKLEADIVDPWLDSARQKHLIVQKGNDLQLHFEDPKIPSLPQTKFKQYVVSKPYNFDQRVSKKYSKTQIERISRAIFGQDFTIRSTKEVYLPVYHIEVQNGDGSVMDSAWNAITGVRITSSYQG